MDLGPMNMETRKAQTLQVMNKKENRLLVGMKKSLDAARHVKKNLFRHDERELEKTLLKLKLDKRCATHLGEGVIVPQLLTTEHPLPQETTGKTVKLLCDYSFDSMVHMSPALHENDSRFQKLNSTRQGEMLHQRSVSDRLALGRSGKTRGKYSLSKERERSAAMMSGSLSMHTESKHNPKPSYHEHLALKSKSFFVPRPGKNSFMKLTQDDDTSSTSAQGGSLQNSKKTPSVSSGHVDERSKSQFAMSRGRRDEIDGQFVTPDGPSFYNLGSVAVTRAAQDDTKNMKIRTQSTGKLRPGLMRNNNNVSFSGCQKKLLGYEPASTNEIQKSKEEKSSEIFQGMPMNPVEVLSCKYLRLSSENVKSMEELCRREGIDIGLHPHTKDLENIRLITPSLTEDK